MSEKVDINSLHNKLIGRLIEHEQIKSPAVEAAFRAVDRRHFLPEVESEEVYKNQAIPTRFDEDNLPISSSSQPSIMAIMLEQLDLQPGQQVLEVGAGTGYNAALMAYLVGQGGQVTTMDIDEEIVMAARKHLKSAGATNVTVVCGDGMNGFTGNAPYDAIILTVGGWEIAPAWLEQLKPDGRILLPLSLNGPQYSIAFDRAEQGLTSVSIEPCGFMRLRGPYAEAGAILALDEEKPVYLGYQDNPERPFPINAEQVKGWLAAPHEAVGTGLQVTLPDLWKSFNLWLALQAPDHVSLEARKDGLDLIPVLMGGWGDSPWAMSMGLVGEGGMAFYERPSGWPPEDAEQEQPWKIPFELLIRGFGQAAGLVERLGALAKGWEENGRPGMENMQVRVLPLDDEQTGDAVVRRRWHKFVVDWKGSD